MQPREPRPELAAEQGALVGLEAAGWEPGSRSITMNGRPSTPSASASGTGRPRPESARRTANSCAAVGPGEDAAGADLRSTSSRTSPLSACASTNQVSWLLPTVPRVTVSASRPGSTWSCRIAVTASVFTSGLVVRAGYAGCGRPSTNGGRPGRMDSTSAMRSRNRQRPSGQRASLSR